MQAARRLVASLLLVPLALACTAPVPEQTFGPVPEWTLQRGLVIGAPDDPTYGLSSVGGMLADEQHLYVLVPQDGAIRVFTRDGEFVRDLGSRGEGPGELTLPGFMGWRGPATIWVGDTGLRRFTFFDVDTGASETIPYRAYTPEARGTTRLEPVVVLAGLRAAAAPLPSGSGQTRGTLAKSPMVALDTAGTVRDTLAVLAMPISTVITTGLSTGGVLHLDHPLEAGDRWGFADDGSSAVVVENRSWRGAGSAEFGVTRLNSEGDTLFHRRIAYEPHPVPDRYYDDQIDLLSAYPVVVNRPALADAVRDFYEEIRYFPPVTSAMLGSDGTTWVAGARKDGERDWIVLDQFGSLIGRFRLPATSWLAYANRIECWIVEKDALDIPYVVRYGILR